MTLKTSFKEVVSLFLTNLILVSMLPFFHLTVHALDVPSTGSATGDWATSQVVSAAKTAIEGAVLSHFSDANPTTLAILEAELGFVNALEQDVWAMQNGIEDFTIDGKTVSVVSGVARVTIDGVSELITITLSMSTDGCCFRGPHGIYGLARSGAGLSPWLSYEYFSWGSYCYYHLTGNSSNYFLLMSGSFFDNPTPLETPTFTNSAITFVWLPSGDAPTITTNSWHYTSSSISTTAQLFRSSQPVMDIDTSSDDVPSIMSAYKSSLADKLGISVEDVDEVWTLPDEIPEEPTDPSGSGCCCEPFELPSEWVQSDVVELETDHYTVPYTDLIREPYNYLLYGATNMPPPVTPADDSKKVLQTKTTTKQATRSGDPVKDLKDTDPEMYEALMDYSAFITDILDRSGVLPYWAILMAAGALFLII